MCEDSLNAANKITLNSHLQVTHKGVNAFLNHTKDEEFIHKLLMGFIP